MIDWQPRNLKNDKVKLLPVTQSDYDEMYAVSSDPLLWEQHPAPRHEEELFREYFKEAITSGTAFTIRDAQTNEIIGSSRYYEIDEANKSVAIGYTFLARKYWGGEYNKALKSLMLDHAFQFVDKVIFHIGQGNKRSQLGTGKIGAVRTAEIMKDLPGGPTPYYEYTLAKKDYELNR